MARAPHLAALFSLCPCSTCRVSSLSLQAIRCWRTAGRGTYIFCGTPSCVIVAVLLQRSCSTRCAIRVSPLRTRRCWRTAGGRTPSAAHRATLRPRTCWHTATTSPSTGERAEGVRWETAHEACAVLIPPPFLFALLLEWGRVRAVDHSRTLTLYPLPDTLPSCPLPHSLSFLLFRCGLGVVMYMLLTFQHSSSHPLLPPSHPLLPCPGGAWVW